MGVIQVISQNKINKFAKENFDKGEIELHLGDFKEALRYFNLSLSASKDFAEAYYSRGKTLLKLNQPETALADFQQILKINPRMKAAWFYIGAIYYQKSEYEKAIQFYSEAINLDSNYAIALNYRAEALKMTGKYHFALVDYDKAIHLDPKAATLYFGRGKCYLKLQKATEAEADFSKAIALEPRVFIYYQYRADARFIKSDFTGTSADIEKMIEMNKDSVDIHYYSLNAYCKAQNKEFDAAISQVNHLLLNYPDRHDLYAERATYFVAKSYYKDAINDYTQAILLRSDVPEYYFQCSKLYFEIKDYQNTLVYCNSVLLTEPENKEMHYLRGYALHKLGRKKEAGPDLAEAYRLGYPKDKFASELKVYLKKYLKK